MAPSHSFQELPGPIPCAAAKASHIVATQDIESLPVRSCDMDTWQRFSNCSGGGSLERLLMRGKISSKLWAALASAKLRSRSHTCHESGSALQLRVQKLAAMSQ